MCVPHVLMEVLLDPCVHRAYFWVLFITHI